MIQFAEFQSNQYIADIKADTQGNIKRAFLKLSSRLPNNVKRVFLGGRGKQGTRDGEGEPWQPTSRVALMFRTTYPKTSGKKTGKKGFTQQQAQYLYSTPTLIDTGALSKSPQTMEMTLDNNPLEMIVASPLPYASLHDMGGKTQFNGKDIDVPSRPIFFFTTMDQKEINDVIESEFSYDG